MTSKRFWMQTIPNHVSLFQFNIIRVLALLCVKWTESGISIISMSKYAFVYKYLSVQKCLSTNDFNLIFFQDELYQRKTFPEQRDNLNELF